MRAARWIPWLVLAIVLAAGIGWGIDASFPWDVDNLAPGSVLKGLAARFAPGWSSSYGPLPYYLMAAVYVPLLGVAKLTHQLGTPSGTYPFGFAHPGFWIAALVVGARAVSLLLAMGFAAAAWNREKGFDHRVPAVVIVALLVGSPVFVYYARTSNVDMHFVFWIGLAFALVEHPRVGLGRLAAGAVAAAAAVCSKEQIAPYAVVVVLLAIGRAMSSARDTQSGLARAALVAAASLLTFAVLWQLPFNRSGFEKHLHFLFEEARYPRTYAADARGMAGLASAVVRLMPVALGWPMIAGLLMAPLVRPKVSDLGARAVASALYLIGFIAMIGYVYPRFLLPLFLLTVPVAARSWADAIEAARTRPAWRWAPAAALAVLALLGGPVLDVVTLRDTRYRVEDWLRRNLPAGSTVEVIGNPHFQPRVAPSLTMLWTKADELATAPRAPRGDVVLVSGYDGAFESIARDARLRATYYEPLAGASSSYEITRYEPSPLGRLVPNLPVDPPITLYRRIGPAAGAKPRSGGRRQRGSRPIRRKAVWKASRSPSG